MLGHLCRCPIPVVFEQVLDEAVGARVGGWKPLVVEVPLDLREERPAALLIRDPYGGARA